MLDGQTIQRFLATNSSIKPQAVIASTEQATLQTKYRPDKLCPRDQYLKWDLIFSGVDTPHKLARGGLVGIIDRAWLATELNDINDFEI